MMSWLVGWWVWQLPPVTMTTTVWEPVAGFVSWDLLSVQDFGALGKDSVATTFVVVVVDVCDLLEEALT